MSQRLRVPTACRELAELVAREHGHVHRSADLTPEATVQLLQRCDALRRPQRFAQLLLACECDARGRAGRGESAYEPRQRLWRAAESVRRVPTESLAAQALARGVSGPQLGRIIHDARVAALTATEADPAP
jgi:tRNA nucleotidyltransferase (CCA-adding enzyme)